MCSLQVILSVMYCMYRYQNSPDLRLTWLQHMAEKHISVSCSLLIFLVDNPGIVVTSVIPILRQQCV